MPNTTPVNDNQSITEFILDQARTAGNAHVFPVGAITKGSEGKELAEIGDLRRGGGGALFAGGQPGVRGAVGGGGEGGGAAVRVPGGGPAGGLPLSGEGVDD